MKKKAIPVLVVIFLILILGGAYLVFSNLPSNSRIDPEDYYQETVQEGEALIILGAEILPDRAVLRGNGVYIPLSLVQHSLNQAFYWDVEGQRVLYASPNELIKEPVSENGNVINAGNNIYIEQGFVKKHTDINVTFYDNPSRLVIQYQWENVRLVGVRKKTALRIQPKTTAGVLTDVYQGDSLWYQGETENWYQVSSMDGYIGYIRKKEAMEPEVRTIQREVVEPYSYLLYPGKVNMAWHQVTSEIANEGLDDAVANVSGINVISPTWFSVADNEGNLSSIATRSYVENAHNRGWQVWGLLDNFTYEIDTDALLSSTSARHNLVRQVVEEAILYELDGINVDFEYLSEEAGPHFLEFLRELSYMTHKNQIILSVDNPVPEDFTSHYDRKEQARVVDYVVIMGYDEHYVGSDAGSVASLPWVEKGILDTLEEVPAERTINGVPFYCRVWKEKGMILDTEAIGMADAQEVLSVHHVDAYWDNSVGQYYGKYEDDDGNTCEIWVEDAQSIAAKAQLVSKYGLGGIAEWKLGFETPDVWQAISANLQDS